MDDRDLKISLRHSSSLSAAQHDEVIEICSAAYDEDMVPYARDIGAGWHILGTVEGLLVSHAMWVARSLRVGRGPDLNTAYVELVATCPDHQGRGFATQVMAHLRNEVQEYELAALSPAKTTLYERLGWEYWRGDLHIRTDEGRESTPDESVMILRLPNTPAELDLCDDLSVEWRSGEVW